MKVAVETEMDIDVSSTNLLPVYRLVLVVPHTEMILGLPMSKDDILDQAFVFYNGRKTSKIL